MEKNCWVPIALQCVATVYGSLWGSKWPTFKTPIFEDQKLLISKKNPSRDLLIYTSLAELLASNPLVLKREKNPQEQPTFISRISQATVSRLKKLFVTGKKWSCFYFFHLFQVDTTLGGFICTSPSWLSVTSSSSQCGWTRMASQMIECYQFRCHFAEPQKR